MACQTAVNGYQKECKTFEDLDVVAGRGLAADSSWLDDTDVS